MLYWCFRKDVIPTKRICRGFFLFLLLCTCSIQTTAASAIRVNLNGKAISFDAQPFIDNGRVLVPMRGILESLGYTVYWQSHTQTVLAVNENTRISLPLGSNKVSVNGKSVSIDAPAQLKNSRTFVPLRFLAEYSGADVSWNGRTSTVSITSDTVSMVSAKDSVVYIQTNKMQGSGVVLSSDGLIATNFHMIENASTAQFLFNDGSIYQGKTTVVGLDPEADIALLKISKTGLKAASISTSYAIGDAVTAIGSPDGNRNKETTGVINGFDQDIISTSAVISHGSSGGGLFNSNGQLIGMTSAYGNEQYLSIPISLVKQVPQNLSIPLSEMKNYTYTPHGPENLRYTKSGNYAYVSWSPVYGADYYYVSFSRNQNGPFTHMKNKTLGSDHWYWGFPQCFGITANKSFYLKVTAVVDGVPTADSEVLKVIAR